MSLSPLAANLHVRQVEQITSVRHARGSRPFVERLIGTIRRDCLDRVFFWNAVGLARMPSEFKDDYSASRPHRSLDGTTHGERGGAA